jgi:hypothetical protein
LKVMRQKLTRALGIVGERRLQNCAVFRLLVALGTDDEEPSGTLPFRRPRA